MNKNETAHYINFGAVNPKAIVNSLHELLQADTRDFDAIRRDPAYRVIVGQLGWLFGVSLGADIADQQAIDAAYAKQTESKQL